MVDGRTQGSASCVAEAPGKGSLAGLVRVPRPDPSAMPRAMDGKVPGDGLAAGHKPTGETPANAGGRTPAPARLDRVNLPQRCSPAITAPTMVLLHMQGLADPAKVIQAAHRAA